jgi:hypothetical protein
MIGMPALIGRAANNPTPLIADLRFCHRRFRRCSLISSPHSFIDRINSERRMNHITSSLPCGQQKRQNPLREIIGKSSPVISAKPVGVWAVPQTPGFPRRAMLFVRLPVLGD